MGCVSGGHLVFYCNAAITYRCGQYVLIERDVMTQNKYVSDRGNLLVTIR
jgi:hypothetical protein